MEVPTVYSVSNASTVGILHESDAMGHTGVLFIVGGRQYRTGAQRQFVRLARRLASEGYPVFRFDIRGTGDSTCEPLHFLDSAPDITAAVEEFRRLAPQLERIVLWGLCDGASAAILYASEHKSIDAVMMVNPWITTEVGAARTIFKHHYQKRLVSLIFWKKLFSGDVNVLHALSSLGSEFQRWVIRRGGDGKHEVDLPTIVFDAIERFTGGVNIIVSEKDLTAKEFKDEFDKRVADRFSTSLDELRVHSVDADHTFSSQEQHACLESLTLDWCKSQNSNASLN